MQFIGLKLRNAPPVCLLNWSNTHFIFTNSFRLIGRQAYTSEQLEYCILKEGSLANHALQQSALGHWDSRSLKERPLQDKTQVSRHVLHSLIDKDESLLVDTLHPY